MARGKVAGRLFPGILAASFAGTLAVSVVLTAVLLDSMLMRYDRGSVTTMLPGFTYGNALILKVGLFYTAILGVYAFATIGSSHNSGVPHRRPVWGMLAVMLYAMAPILGTVVVLVTQSIMDEPTVDTIGYFAQISQTGVVALLGILVTSFVSAFVSLARKERPRGLSIISLLIDAFVIAVFVYWEFYKLGFDQDRWNAI